jgi:hypothetical protein
MLEYDELYCKKSNGEDVFSKLGTSFEEVMNLPISYLDLDPALEKCFSKCKKTVNGEMQPRFVVIGDLVNCGKNSLERIIQSDMHIHLKEVDLMQDMEEKLAQYALKLKDSDFSVYHIRCSKLNFGKNDSDTKAWLKSDKEYKTIGDLYTLNQRGLVRKVGDTDRATRVLKALQTSLMQYGVIVERDVSRQSVSSRKLAKLYNADSPLFPKIKEAVKKHREECHSVETY